MAKLQMRFTLVKVEDNGEETPLVVETLEGRPPTTRKDKDGEPREYDAGFTTFGKPVRCDITELGVEKFDTLTIRPVQMYLAKAGASAGSLEV